MGDVVTWMVGWLLIDITSRLVIIYLGWQDLAQDWLIRSYLSANQVCLFNQLGAAGIKLNDDF